MIWLLVIIFWASPIWLSALISKMRVARAERVRRDEHIMYALTGIRDDMAIKALRGEIALNGEVFRFFYNDLSKRIDSREGHGMCYSRLIRAHLRNQRHPKAVQRAKMLLRQIKKSDDGVKAMTLRLVHAHQLMLLDARWSVRVFNLFTLLHATKASLSRWLGRHRFVPEPTRNFARFTDALSHAATVRHAELCPAWSEAPR